MSTLNKTNWLAIAACIVAAMILGFLWYGAIFQSQWMAGNGITASEDGKQMFKNGTPMDASMMPMVVNTLFMVVYAFIMNWLLGKAGAQTLQSGALVGLAVGATHLLNVIVGNMFSGASGSLSMVDGSYSLVLFTVMGAILGGWQKK